MATQITNKSKLEKEITFKISRFKEVIKRTKPHKHSEYYELIFLLEGEGFHTVDTTTYKVTTPEFYMLSAGQLHFWQFTSIPKGFVILIKEEEFDKLKESKALELLKKLTEIDRISLVENSIIFTILEDLFATHINNSEFAVEITHSYITAILAKLLAIANIEKSKIHIPLPKIYLDFIAMISSNICAMHKVNEYAATLHTTPQNINALCRKYNKASAGELISSQLILEAKRYLLHTDNTIFEIADALGFDDVSNFIKFFKRIEKITPKQFKVQHFQ